MMNASNIHYQKEKDNFKKDTNSKKMEERYKKLMKEFEETKGELRNERIKN